VYVDRAVTRTFAAGVLTPILLLSARSSVAHDPVPSNLTFARDIRPILTAHCTNCHAAGGSAPMPLTAYEHVQARGRQIREQIVARRMPKWHAARGFGAFVNDPTLTPHEQAIVVAWIDAGMPEGTPRGLLASRPATGFAAADPAAMVHVIVPARGDVGRTAGDQTQWITGWTFTPGDPLITAAVASVDGVPVATWVAGDRPARLPAGTAFRSGARIRVDVRRRAARDDEHAFVPRRSVFTLLTETEAPLRRAWTEQVACGALRGGPPAGLLAVRPLLDRDEARLSIARAGAPAAMVGWIRGYDPLYPRTYWLLRPLDLAPDARLIADAPCRVELTLTAAAAARR
jgi:hypothetical protein